jgi:transcriptional regulator with XRE-family HTH domain
MKRGFRRVSRGRAADLGRITFAARLRAARAVLGWSQTELGRRVGLTQRAINRLENAATRPRQLTRSRIDKAFKKAGIILRDLSDGGFEVRVPMEVMAKQASSRAPALRRSPFSRSAR